MAEGPHDNEGTGYMYMHDHEILFLSKDAIPHYRGNIVQLMIWNSIYYFKNLHSTGPVCACHRVTRRR